MQESEGEDDVSLVSGLREASLFDEARQGARWRRGNSGGAIEAGVLVVVDVLMIGIASAVALAGRSGLGWFSQAGDLDELVAPLAVYLTVGWILLLAIWGAYQAKRLLVGTQEYVRVLSASTTMAGLLGITAYLFQYPLSRGYFLLLFTIGIPLLLVGRFTLRRLIHRARQAGRFLTPMLLAGDTSHVEDLATVLRRERWLGYEVIGVLTDDPVGSVAGVPVVGRPTDASAALTATTAGGIIFTEGSFTRSVLFNRMARELEDHNAQMIVVPALTDISAERMTVRPVAGIALVHIERPTAQAASRWAKRAFDLAGSSALIVALSPVMAATALAIKLSDGGGVFFRQERVGLKGELFECLKFRSMYTDAEARLAELETCNESDGVLFKMANDPRVTPVGRFIRRFSIDELPQLFNVWRGQMSLVGPRPALPREVAVYKEHVLRRLDARPGMTGLWQVSGRSDLSWDDTVRLDLYYVDNWSMVQDLAILAKTLGAVVSSRGAY